MSRAQALQYDIDGLEEIAEELGATEYQMKAAFSRAIKRTMGTMRKKVIAGTKDEIQARKLDSMRRRMRVFRLQKGAMDGIKLWFGVNDFRTSALKGKAKRLGTKKKPKGAAYFRVTGDVVTHKSAFILNRNGRKIFHRTTKQRDSLTELKAPINKGIEEKVEDEIFQDLQDVFMHHFITDLRGRLRMNLNRDGF